MIRRAVNAILDKQAWADPLGEALQKLYLAVLSPVPVLKDLLHGTWLGHALHPVITDVPVGALTVALVLDLIGLGGAPQAFYGANVAILVGIAGMVAAALTGVADYTGTYGRDRRYGTIHSLVMVLSLVAYLFSALIRTDVIPGTVQSSFGTALLGYLLLALGAFIGGEITFGTGYMVDRHAWESDERTWVRLDRTELPEGQPVRAQAGGDAILLVKRGDTVHAIHDTCSHAGCSLAEGMLVPGGDTIECGCHGSRFDLRTGLVARGPATYDQPRFEVRQRDGGLEVRRVTSAQSQA